MKIEKGDIKEFGQRRWAAKYTTVFDKIIAMNVGEVIKVTLDETNLNFSNIVQQYFRVKRFPDFKVQARRLDKEGKKFLFLKSKRIQGG